MLSYPVGVPGGIFAPKEAGQADLFAGDPELAEAHGRLQQISASLLPEERGEIEVNCDFCNAAYVFDKVDAEQLFAADITPPVSKTKH